MQWCTVWPVLYLRTSLWPTNHADNIPLHRQSQYQQTLPWVSGWVSHQLEMEGGKSAPIVRAPVFMRIQIILWDNVREPDGEACDIEIKLETTPTCFNNMLSRFFYSNLLPCFVKFHSKSWGKKMNHNLEKFFKRISEYRGWRVNFFFL